MAESVAAKRVGRCPVCLVHMRYPELLRPGSRLKCPKCGNSFPIDDILPLRQETSHETINIDTSKAKDKFAASEQQAEQKHNPIVWLAIITFLLAVAVVVIWFSMSMKGPPFLALYAIVFGVTWLVTLMIRHTRGDAWYVSVLACAFFLGIGLARFALGMQAGMRKFGFLWVMMGVGSLLLFVRAKEGKGSGYGILGGCAIGCGSAGGGGCGGGGCGSGCGGCGGCGG